MPSLPHQFRQAVRSLRRRPSVTLAAILCLGLGLGATTAVFSAVYGALMRPLPFREPGRLVSVFRTTPYFRDGPFSPGNAVDLRREVRTVESLAIIRPGSGLLSRAGESMQVGVFGASGNLFSMLGVAPLRGRLLEPADEEPGSDPVMVVSEELWRERLGADPGAIGQSMRVDGELRTVIGVLPRGLDIPHGFQVYRSDVWVPLQFDADDLTRRRSNYLSLVGRLQPGATLGQAAAEMDRLMAGLVERFPELHGEGIRVGWLARESVRPVRGPLLLLLGAVSFVLLIAASNVASLLLARGVERRRELAIQAALGAGRSGLVRGTLVEAFVLVGGGVVLGLALALAGVRAIGSLAAAQLPQLRELGVNLPVLGFAVALAGAVALVCGLVPALRAARTDPHDVLRGGDRAGGDARRHRFLRALAVAEVSLSLVLLLGAGLALRGFGALVSRPPGFDPEPLLTLEATLDPDRYPGGATAGRFLDPALAAIRAVPGVAEAGAISLIPYDNWGWNFNIRYEGQPGDDPTRLPIVETRAASSSLFATLGMTVLRGRLPHGAELEPDGPVVAVANRALVARDFPDRDPLGARFHWGSGFATIVGVVSDIRNTGPASRPQPEVYWIYRRHDGTTRYPLVVRTARGNPSAVAPAVVAAVRAVDPTAAITRVRPMSAVIAASVGGPRFYVLLLGAFAGVALLLALAGLYGLMSYLVAQRTREIGIRMALGSTPGRTVALVFGQGGRLVAAGLAVGLAAGWAVTRLLRALLFGVSPLDPLAWIVAALALGVAAGAAIVIPARRATRVDPLAAVRNE